MDEIYKEAGGLVDDDVKDIAQEFLESQEGPQKEVIHEKKIYSRESERRLMLAGVAMSGAVVLLFYVLVMYTGIVYIPRVTPQTSTHTDSEKEAIFTNL